MTCLPDVFVCKFSVAYFAFYTTMEASIYVVVSSLDW
jgi:hypothetical protein